MSAQTSMAVALYALHLGDVTECGTVRSKSVRWENFNQSAIVTIHFTDNSSVTQTGPVRPKCGRDWAPIRVFKPAECLSCGDLYECEHDSLERRNH